MFREERRQAFRIGHAMMLEEHATDCFTHLAGKNGHAESRDINAQAFRSVDTMSEQLKEFLPAHKAKPIVD